VVLAVISLGTGIFGLLPSPIVCCLHDSRTTAVANIATIVQSLTEYFINNNGTYPTSLQALVIPDAYGHCYLEGLDGKRPLDPWKHEFHYEPPTPAYPKPHVWSNGADGKRGGTGDDADIDSDRLLDSED
jgi:general secretion pathway protein G